MDQTKSAIAMKNVSFSYKKGGDPVLAVDDLTVSREEKVFIQGPSGCGKTTLLGLLGGVLKTAEGELTVLDRNLKEMSGAKRDRFRASHMGFIFQMFNLIPYLSVIENVLLPCRFSPERKKGVLDKSASLEEEAKRLLADLGLTGKEIVNRPVIELSVGQQQRVAAARALLGGPEILIADEPTSSLDADARESFINLLFQECRLFSTTLVFVSHDSSLARLFDRTINLKEVNHASGKKIGHGEGLCQ